MSNFKENVNMFTVSDSLKAPMIHGHIDFLKTLTRYGEIIIVCSKNNTLTMKVTYTLNEV